MTIPSSPIQTVLAALLRRGCKPIQSGSGWKAHCPAHDDRNRSLSVFVGRGGEPRLHCFAGCSKKEVAAALDLKSADLCTSGEANSNGCAAQIQQADAKGRPARDWKQEADRFCNHPAANEKRRELASLLDVTLSSLEALRTGWKENAWTFPERDGDGRIIGIATRKPDSSKRSLPNSKRGITYPDDWLAGAGPVLIVEGASDTAAGLTMGLSVVGRPSNIGGTELLTDLLRGVPPDRPIVVMGENDRKDDGRWPGRDGAKKIAAGVADALGRPVDWALPPDHQKDLRTWMQEHGRNGQRFVESLELHRVEPAAPNSSVETSSRRTVASKLVALAKAHIRELWHSPGADPQGFATIEREGHPEHWPITSRAFKRWLQQTFWEEVGEAINSQSLSDASNTLQSMALFSGSQHPVALRIAEHDGDIYIDLCDDDWRAVRVSRDGWEVVANPPIRFTRRRGMLPLPTPERGGTVDELRGFLNVDADSDWVMVKAWLLAALSPRGPFPVLQLSGEQGTGKSTACRLLRAFVDPSESPIRSAPRDERDLVISARNSWVIAFDNLTGMPGWLSDAMCRLATGGGFSTRQLYTDDEEILFSFQRPAIINGIAEAARRPDLVDRCLAVTLAPIPESVRTTEAELWRRFREAQPRILGGLLDLLAKALSRRASVQLSQLPRMADFAVWATAALGKEFLAAYDANRQSAAEDVLAGDVVAGAVRKLATADESWEGTATELLKALERMVPESVVKQREWPKAANALSARLRELAPALRKVGVYVEWNRKSDQGRTRMIKISAANGHPRNRSSTSSEPSGTGGDATCERPAAVRTGAAPSVAEVVKSRFSDDADGSDDVFTDALSDDWDEV